MGDLVKGVCNKTFNQSTNQVCQIIATNLMLGRYLFKKDNITQPITVEIKPQNQTNQELLKIFVANIINSFNYVLPVRKLIKINHGNVKKISNQLELNPDFLKNKILIVSEIQYGIKGSKVLKNNNHLLPIDDIKKQIIEAATVSAIFLLCINPENWIVNNESRLKVIPDYNDMMFKLDHPDYFFFDHIITTALGLELTLHDFIANYKKNISNNCIDFLKSIDAVLIRNIMLKATASQEFLTYKNKIIPNAYIISRAENIINMLKTNGASFDQSKTNRKKK